MPEDIKQTEDKFEPSITQNSLARLVGGDVHATSLEVVTDSPAPPTLSGKKHSVIRHRVTGEERPVPDRDFTKEEQDNYEYVAAESKITVGEFWLRANEDLAAVLNWENRHEILARYREEEADRLKKAKDYSYPLEKLWDKTCAMENVDD